MQRLKSFKQRQRQRELAGDQRAGVWARGQARRKQRRFLIQNWPVSAGGGASILLSAIVGAAIVDSTLLSGVILGATLVGLPGAVYHLTVLATGTGPTMMGDAGEQSTAGALRKLQRQGWKVVNHVVLRGKADIDHVVVGPDGLFVIETKWSAEPWGAPETDHRVGAAIRQANDNARLVSLWHPVKSLGVHAAPVVVLWGGGGGGSGDASHWETPRLVDGATVVHGRDTAGWTSRLPRHQISDRVVADVWTALERQVEMRDEALSSDERTPPSVSEIVAPIAGGIGAAMFAFVGLVHLWESSSDPALQLVWGAALTTGAAALVATRLAPAIGWGVLAGVGLPTSALGLAALAQATTGG